MYLSEEIAEIRIAYVIGSPIGFAVRATGLVRKGPTMIRDSASSVIFLHFSPHDADSLFEMYHIDGVAVLVKSYLNNYQDHYWIGLNEFCQIW